MQIEYLEKRWQLAAAHPVAVNFIDETLYEENFATALAHAKSLGVTAVRMWVGFDSLSDRPYAWEPYYPYGTHPSFNDPGTEPMVNTVGNIMKRAFQLYDAGMSVMLVFNDRQSEAPESADAVRGFFQYMMDAPEYPGAERTLKDVVEYWQIGNEVDSATYWKPSGSSKTTGIRRYVNELLIPAAEVLKAGGEKVVSAGPSWNPSDLEIILSTLQAAGKLDLIEYAGYHPYGTYDPTRSSVNQIADRTAAAVRVGNKYGKELIASEWNVRGFGNTGSNDTKWAAVLDEVYRNTILPNYHAAFYFSIINNWAARGGSVSARPGGLLKHDTIQSVSPSSSVSDLRAYYESPLIPSEPFYSTFASWQYGAVSGVVVDATTGSGLAGFSLTLFVDTNADGKLTPGEPSATTDSQGRFQIRFALHQVTKLPHTLSVILPAGWSLETALPDVVLTPSATISNQIVTVRRPVPTLPSTTRSISGTLFNDSNANGIFEPEAGETVTGVRTVFLDQNRNGKLDSGEPRTSSDSQGRFTFSKLAAGTYYVSRVFPKGYRMSNNTAGYLTVTLAAGQTVTDIQIGTTNQPVSSPASPVVPGSISGRLFYDNDADGQWDSGESWQSGKTVYLDLNNNARLDSGEPSARSGYLGAFTFKNVLPGTYRVRRVLPESYIITTPSPMVLLLSGVDLTGVLIGTGKPRLGV